MWIHTHISLESIINIKTTNTHTNPKKTGGTASPSRSSRTPF